MGSEKAGLLRTAAQELRQASAGLPKGPWRAEVGFDVQVVDPKGNRVAYDVFTDDADPERVVGYVALMDPTVAAALADWLDDEAAAMDRQHAAAMLREPQAPSAQVLGYRSQRIDERVARKHLNALRVAGRVLGADSIPPRYPVDMGGEDGDFYLIRADLPDDEALAVVNEWRVMEGYDPLDPEGVKQVTRGWYRKNPCPPNLCGEHGWHLGDGRKGQYGAFRGTLVEAL